MATSNKKLDQITRIFFKGGFYVSLILTTFPSHSCELSFKSLEVYLNNTNYKYSLILSFPDGCKTKEYLRMNINTPKIQLVDENHKVIQEASFKEGSYLESTNRIFLSGLKSGAINSCLQKSSLVVDFKKGMIQSQDNGGMFFDLSNGDSYNCKI